MMPTSALSRFCSGCRSARGCRVAAAHCPAAARPESSSQRSPVLLKAVLPCPSACSCDTGCCTCCQAITMNVKFVPVHASLTFTDQMSDLLRQAFERLTRSAVPESVGLVFCSAVGGLDGCRPRRVPSRSI
ncbi:hypothetical protein MESS2_1670049 [Mesorhizobium metallidurans STM 2683]|uniref:Uncharacterized protein n=3 Tax=Mesorhizobium TaxID=68287 RepID=A0A1R3V4M7_9HYPH|nr:conserved hypothetical protein [Mesorhizobium ventifaucium]CCV05820.1 hypothetical protein MESS2_1670049 [Mesorhizobium metallidurans STM 2683]SIT54779.1 conserved hypothetical protein [Mesorhizobium prunaredense]